MDALTKIICAIMILIGIGVFVFYIVLIAKYGNMPVSEVPLWVTWFLFRD